MGMNNISKAKTIKLGLVFVFAEINNKLSPSLCNRMTVVAFGNAGECGHSIDYEGRRAQDCVARANAPTARAHQMTSVPSTLVIPTQSSR